ncbi:MAG TPA: hypothetical protein VN957_00430, partial [Chthoniobacterales bacterium]|nr:hypothetical protein [Chthoniobacterales bacterium]
MKIPSRSKLTKYVLLRRRLFRGWSGAYELARPRSSISLNKPAAGIAIRQQATTQKTAERAWMIITPDKPEGWEPMLPPEQPGVPARLNVFRAAMKNVGRTPAHVTKIAARYINLDKSEFEKLPEEPDYGRKESLESMLLVPGDSFPKAVPLWPKSRLTTEEIESIRTAKSFLYFYACIEYRALGK